MKLKIINKLDIPAKGGRKASHFNIQGLLPKLAKLKPDTALRIEMKTTKEAKYLSMALCYYKNKRKHLGDNPLRDFTLSRRETSVFIWKEKEE